MICQLEFPSAPTIPIHGDPRVKFLRSVRHALEVNTSKLFDQVKTFSAIKNNAYLDAYVIEAIISHILESSSETFCQAFHPSTIERWASWLDEEIDWNGYAKPAPKISTLFRSIRALLKDQAKLHRQLHKAELYQLHITKP